MKLLLRFLVPVFFVSYLSVTTLILVVNACWTFIRTFSVQAVRNYASYWMTRWSARLQDLLGNGILAMRVGFNPEWTLLRVMLRGRAIFVFNHQSADDIPVGAQLLWLIGLPNTRWVVKWPLFFAGGIGLGLWLSGSAGVSRKKGSRKDIRRIQHMAELARRDGASVAIFPEGTRFKESKRSNGYERVLEPNAGLLYLIKALPEYDIVWVTIEYKVRPVPYGLRDLADFYGREVVVHWEVEHPDALVDTKTRRARLKQRWHNVDHLLQNSVY